MGRAAKALDATARGVSLPAKPCSFVRRHHVCRSVWASGGGGVVLHRPQTLVPSSGGTTSIGSDGPSAAGTWCFTARKPLFLRSEAPRLSVRMGLRRRRRGASPPANPYSFARRHHVYRLKGRRPQWDVVLHRPQTLIPSYGSTTSFGPDGPLAAGTWCFTARKPLFLRTEAPRLSVRMGLRRLGRGASPPANPYAFVRKHHVFRSGWASGGWDVVLHRPQTLMPSSGGTTSVGPDGPSAAGTWCFTARKPLFLRTEAPRLSTKGPPDAMGRGASPPANPFSFVLRHHV